MRSVEQDILRDNADPQIITQFGHAMTVTAATAEPSIIEVIGAHGARYELLAVVPAAPWNKVLYWIPAMGIAARHYLPLAHALADRGVAVVLHEWRGIGSSDQRASRDHNWGYKELLEEDLPAGLAVLAAHWPQAHYWIGGHSLGGQLGVLYAALHPDRFAGIVLVASGAPYWRRFRRGWLIGVAYVVAPLIAKVFGYLPGRRLGFGGNEARGVIADWSRSGRTGRYAASGMALDLERRLAELSTPVLALRLEDDWLGPAASLAWLVGKLGPGPRLTRVIGAEQMGGAPADHFSWMKRPDSIAVQIAGELQGGDMASVAPTDAPG